MIALYPQNLNTVTHYTDTQWQLVPLLNGGAAISLDTVMGFRGFAQVRVNPFLECHDNQQTHSCFLL